MPIAGLLAWCMIGIAGLLLSPFAAAMVVFAGTGSVIYLGLLISIFTGENFLAMDCP